MKKCTSLMLLLALVLALSAPVYAQSTTRPYIPQDYYGNIDFESLSVGFCELTAKNVNIRELPSKSAKSLGMYDRGYPLFAVGKTYGQDGNLWLIVRVPYDSTLVDGYVLEDYVDYIDPYDYAKQRGETAFYRMLSSVYDLSGVDIPRLAYNPDDVIVYAVEKGKNYHYKSTCSNMKYPFELMREAARDLGLEPCSKCGGTTATVSAPKATSKPSQTDRPSQTQRPTQAPVQQSAMVWLSATGSKYHSIPNCGNMNPDKARQVSLDSVRGKYSPCSNCNPPR